VSRLLIEVDTEGMDGSWPVGWKGSKAKLDGSF
jgi:hypothetical protein